MGKRRFGVSLPDELAKAVDELARVWGVDRSTVIAEAVRNYLLLQHTGPTVKGVMVVIDGDEEPLPIDILHEFNDVVKGHLHLHVDGSCLNIVVVKGSRARLSELASRVRSRRPYCQLYYVPLP
jgi:CopG family nickel-responsive transcriptional regulator